MDEVEKGSSKNLFKPLSGILESVGTDKKFRRSANMERANTKKVKSKTESRTEI